MAVVVLPLLLLGVSELGLHLADYGYTTSFFLRQPINGKSMLVENAWFGLRFFPPALIRSPPPIVMAADKPTNVHRIFLLGESAALGDPRPAYGVGRYLEVLLRERFPNSEFEVIPAAMTAINSHGVLESLWILWEKILPVRANL